MPIGAIIGLVLPVINKVIGFLLDLFLTNWTTTLQGTAAGVAVVALLEGMGCNLSLAKESLLGIIAALPGVLATDAKVTGQSLAEAIREAALPHSPEGSQTHT